MRTATLTAHARAREPSQSLLLLEQLCLLGLKFLLELQRSLVRSNEHRLVLHQPAHGARVCQKRLLILPRAGFLQKVNLCFFIDIVQVVVLWVRVLIIVVILWPSGIVCELAVETTPTTNCRGR